mgnify:CR=1 FL=1|jgi:hypothetical protein
MKLEDVKRQPMRERRTCRANIRLYPSQMKFIEDHNLSVQTIFDKALEELGHKTPPSSQILALSKRYDLNEKRKTMGYGRGGKGNARSQKSRGRNK